jgi:hypothetical protein
VIGERLARDSEAAHVGAEIAVGDAELEQTSFAERGDEPAAFGIKVVGIAGQVRGAPLIERVGELAVTRLEEGPGEEGTIRLCPLPAREA